MVDEDKEVKNKVLTTWQGGEHKDISDDYQEAPDTEEQEF